MGRILANIQTTIHNVSGDRRMIQAQDMTLFMHNGREKIVMPGGIDVGGQQFTRARVGRAKLDIIPRSRVNKPALIRRVSIDGDLIISRECEIPGIEVSKFYLGRLEFCDLGVINPGRLPVTDPLLHERLDQVHGRGVVQHLVATDEALADRIVVDGNAR